MSLADSHANYVRREDFTNQQSNSRKGMVWQTFDGV